MTNQPLNTAALRALAEADTITVPFRGECVIMEQSTVLALLDTADRHAALVQAVLASHWNEAARLAREGKGK